MRPVLLIPQHLTITDPEKKGRLRRDDRQVIISRLLDPRWNRGIGKFFLSRSDQVTVITGKTNEYNEPIRNKSERSASGGSNPSDDGF